MKVHTDLLIGRDHVPGAGEPYSIIDPSDATSLAAVTAASPQQVDRAAVAAAAAQPGWWAQPQSERTAALRRAAAGLTAHREDLARLMTHETGRVLIRNRLYVDMAAELFEQYATLARLDAGRIAPANDPDQLSLVLRVPHGVVAVLVPWNYPLLLLAFKAAPALAAGNTLVVKGAPETTLTTLAIGEILAEALPAGVVNVVAGGPAVGDALVRHPSISLVAFTGSTRAGREIGRTCAELIRPAHLELGGKDPALVFADADPRRAAQAVVWAAFLNGGQVCTSTERVYVQRAVYGDFVAHAVTLAERLVVGDPFDPATEVGPMRSEAGRSRVVDQLAAATASGAKVLAGGAPLVRPGFYLRPTVVVGVDHDMELMREETFGPVLPVMPFDDEDEAFALAADTPYGLGASLYTADPVRVHRAARTLPVGMVWVNDPVVDNLAAPFGGVRASGHARELGVEALDSFTVKRHLHWNLALEAKPWWYPFEEE